MSATGSAETASELPSTVILSHELRSLLAAIRLGMSDLNRQLSNECKTDAVNYDLSVIDTAVRRATELTTWVLSAATDPPAGNRRRPIIDVADIVAEVAWDLRPIVSAHPIDVTVPPHLFLAADGIAVRAVITNLVLHAARHAVNGSPIEVVACRTAGGIEVSVATPTWNPTQAQLTELFRPGKAAAPLSVGTVDVRAAQSHASLLGGSVHPVARSGGGTAVTVLLPVPS